MTATRPGGGTLPSPTGAQVLEAVRLLGGGPVQTGPIAFQVCELLGVNSADRTAYDLRGVISWSGLETWLRKLAQDGRLVMRTRQQWRDLSAQIGAGGQGTARAYALPEVDAALAAGPPPLMAGPRWGQALLAARLRVLREHDEEVRRYARAMMEADAHRRRTAGRHGT